MPIHYLVYNTVVYHDILEDITIYHEILQLHCSIYCIYYIIKLYYYIILQYIIICQYIAIYHNMSQYIATKLLLRTTTWEEKNANILACLQYHDIS